MKTRTAIAATLTLVAVTLSPVPAMAAERPDPLQSRIDAILAEFPDGVQIADDSISWQRGEVILTLEGGVSAKTIGTCANGSYCAWSGYSYTGTKLSFTGCSSSGTSNSLAALITKRSLANARSSGTVKAKNGSTVVYTLAASTGLTSTPLTMTNLVCYT